MPENKKDPLLLFRRASAGRRSPTFTDQGLQNRVINIPLQMLAMVSAFEGRGLVASLKSSKFMSLSVTVRRTCHRIFGSLKNSQARMPRYWSQM